MTKKYNVDPTLSHYPDKGCEVATAYLREQALTLLKQLLLAIKEGFQLLNTFGFSLQDKEMFSIRQALQIYRTVVIFNPIKVVDNPAIRQSLAMESFPNQDMLSDISHTVSLGMFRLEDINITTAIFNFASLPVVMVFSPFESSRGGSPGFPSIFLGAMDATPSPIIAEGLSAINAKGWGFLFSKELPHLGMSAFYASTSIPGTGMTAINTRMFVFLSPFLPTIHNSIIATHNLDVNLFINQIQSKCQNCPFPECLEDIPRGKWKFGKGERNAQIIQLLKQGKTPKELASMFGLSVRTILRITACGSKNPSA